MATGYTHKIKDGISFEEFAMGCARADESSDTPVPEATESSSYDKDSLETDEAKLKETLLMPKRRAIQQAKSDYEEKLKRYDKYIEEINDLGKIYKAMLKKVDAWTPPSDEHKELKSFMQEQIKKSIKFDCGNEYWLEAKEKVKQLSGQQWKANEEALLLESMANHKKE